MAHQRAIVIPPYRPKSAACLSNARPESGKCLRVYSAASHRSQLHPTRAATNLRSSTQAPSGGDENLIATPETTVRISCGDKIVCMGLKMGNPSTLDMKNIRIYTVSKNNKKKRITAVLESKNLNGERHSERWDIIYEYPVADPGFPVGGACTH